MDKRTFIVGRGTDSDIVLPHDSISRAHARITMGDDGFVYLEDLGSTNGTTINGKPVTTKTRLYPGDAIRLGTYAFDWEDALIDKAQAVVGPSFSSLSKEAGGRKPSLNTGRVGRFVVTAVAILAVGLSVGAYTMLSDNRTGDAETETSATADQQEDGTVPVTEGQPQTTTPGQPAQEASATPWQEPTTRTRSYSISCLRDSSIIGGIIGIGNDFKTGLFTDEGITVEDERKIGLEVKEQIREEYRFSTNTRYKSRIQVIMNRLLPRVQDTTQYTYQWYILESDEINAFTAGGQIFITTGIIDFAESDDELACVIGHEIYHNELGHIRQKLEEQSFMENWLGTEAAQIALMASSVLTMSFNQENEAYCDLYGLDLAIDAGYNGCSIARFWERMQEDEEEADVIGKLLRTHPYSSERKQCIHQHISGNYRRGC